MINKQKGQIALIAILIISAAVLIVSLTISSMGVNETLMSFDEQQSEQAFQMADGCVNEALLRLRRVYDGEEASYTGETLNFGANSCTINITTQGQNRIINVAATVNSKIIRKIQATVRWNPSFALTNWQEVQ